jgi:hypothetical protein
MKTYGGSGGIGPPFLTSELYGGEWSASSPDRFTPGDRALGTHWIGGWVDPRAGLDTEDRIKMSLYPQSNSLHPVSYNKIRLCVHNISQILPKPG